MDSRRTGAYGLVAACGLGIGCAAPSDDRDTASDSLSSGVSLGSLTTTSPTTSSAATEASSDDSATMSTATLDTSTGADDADTTDGLKFDLMPGLDVSGTPTYPVRMIPNLVSITFYERSGGDAPTPYTFTVNGPELTTRLDDPLSDANRDIVGVTSEFYDVYYSDIDGVFDIDGRYLTISGVFGFALPAGGGLNLAEIGLDFEGLPTEFGNYVASFVALGDNGAPETVDFTIDGDLQTNTTMGNTIGTAERLRVTLGFESSSGPPG